MSAPRRLLLVGLGNRGRMWSEIVAAVPGAVLSAAVDVSEAARAAFAARRPDVPVVPDLASALAAGGHDAVLLVTPPDGHLAQARTIVAAGLPLLAEKPLTLDLPQAIEIVELFEKHRLPLTVGLNFRYLPVTLAYRDLLAGGRLGAPGFGQMTYWRNRDGLRPGLNRYPLTMRQPMMLEQSIHHLDLMRFCYGREALAIACRTWNPGWSMYAHDSNVQAMLVFEGGLEVGYLGTWTGGWNELQFLWRTDCERGAILQRALFEDLATAGMQDTAPTPVPLAEGRPFFDDSAALLRDFLAALDGGPVPCTGRDHLMTLALCFAGIESAETGRTMDVAAFARRQGAAAR